MILVKLDSEFKRTTTGRLDRRFIRGEGSHREVVAAAIHFLETVALPAADALDLQALEVTKKYEATRDAKRDANRAAKEEREA